MFQLSGVKVQYGSRTVLNIANLTLKEPGLYAIVGPNGAGKSTLLHVMAGLLVPSSGECLFGSRPVRQWPRRAFAREVAVVPQSLEVAFAFTAHEIVHMGRSPFSGRLFESEEDEEAVTGAMRLTDCTAFRARDFRSLSGGERQRVILAAALAQSKKVLLLDEPTTFLDLRHQVELYRLLRKLCDEGSLAIAVTHDLNLAAQYSDRVLLLHEGEVISEGTPASVLEPGTIERAFGIRVSVTHGGTGRPWIRYAD